MEGRSLSGMLPQLGDWAREEEGLGQRAPSLPMLVRARVVRRGEREEGDEWVRRRRAEVVVMRNQGGRGSWGANPLLEGRRERPHSVELGGLRGRWWGGSGGSRPGGSPRSPWWGVVPCSRYSPPPPSPTAQGAAPGV